MFQIETVKVEFNNLIIFKVNSSVKLDAARDGMYGHNMSIVYIKLFLHRWLYRYIR